MNKLLFNGIILATIILAATSCQYKFVVEPVTPPSGDTISFSIDVVPIWNNNGNCVSCHTTGNQRPDLSPENAYDELFSLGLVNTQTPEDSEIYKHPHPETTTHTWKKYSGAEAATVLLWIEQGALNN